MNVEVRNEAHLDIAEGVAFYDRQGYDAGDYFYQRIFEDIDSLSDEDLKLCNQRSLYHKLAGRFGLLTPGGPTDLLNREETL